MWSGLRAGFFSALLAMAFAAFLLLLLNRWKRKLAPPALRVLADVVLLVPAIFSLGILGFRG
jgi:fructose-specific phosphotransferase system IIC component